MALKPKAVRKSTVRKSITIHPSITAERVLAAVESQFNSLDDPGFCIACGTDQEGCEPRHETRLLRIVRRTRRVRCGGTVDSFGLGMTRARIRN
jgi:hypothetical protein